MWKFSTKFYYLKNEIKPGVVVQIFDPNTQEEETGVSGV